MIRTGKIARMPNSIREEISFRLENGETGPQIVDWLNTLGAVQYVLELHFDGAPVTEQNLSEWRRGGHQDWKRDQETRAIARDFLNEAEDLRQELDDDPLLDCMSTTVALALARLLREAMAPVPEDAGPDAFEKRHKAALRVIHEMTRWRQSDHHQQQGALRRERWAAECAPAVQAREDAREREAAIHSQSLWDEYTRTLAGGTLTPARREELEAWFDQFPHLFPHWSPENDTVTCSQTASPQNTPDAPTPEDQSKSHQIAPNRTIEMQHAIPHDASGLACVLDCGSPLPLSERPSVLEAKPAVGGHSSRRRGIDAEAGGVGGALQGIDGAIPSNQSPLEFHGCALAEVR